MAKEHNITGNLFFNSQCSPKYNICWFFLNMAHRSFRWRQGTSENISRRKDIPQEDAAFFP